ncbi:MAG: ABC transporter ATP-binding protein [Synergistaceae bacterium]|jgi:oligopeptide transport system ATP-binding protein|nr:ABC transporter ATP-binding protein [Synergistaceae bacterium]
MPAAALLSVKNLRVSFKTSNGVFEAVRGVSFGLHRGDALGIVGESGSGKTVTATSILRLLPENGFITGGEITFDGIDLAGAGIKLLRRVRGDRISMIFQDPMSSLNPLIPVGAQIGEIIAEHRKGLSRAEVREEAVRLLGLVRIPEPQRRYRAYPHELSGGMRQRVMIAIAIACGPDVLIADEPTTALDVTIQEQILKLLKTLRDDLEMSVMFITHDLGVVAELCTRVIVMYGGLIMEEGGADDIFENPSHPYTVGLLKSIPNLAADKSRDLVSIPGSPPDMAHPPKGCPFAPRCGHARNVCGGYAPPMFDAGDSHADSCSHRSACWLLAPGAPANPYKKGEKRGEKR